MIEGKMKKYYKENCLVDQEFVKDSELSVAQYTAKVAKELGGEIKIVKFARFQKGEGLEKRSDDFAAEVASHGEVSHPAQVPYKQKARYRQGYRVLFCCRPKSLPAALDFCTFLC